MYDQNRGFIYMAGLLVIAALICGPMFGGTTIFAVGVAMYCMLVATNAISRGENRVRRQQRSHHKRRRN